MTHYKAAVFPSIPTPLKNSLHTNFVYYYSNKKALAREI